MSLPRRLKKSLEQTGLRVTLLRFYILAVDFFFDMRFGTDTRAPESLKNLTIESGNKERGVGYQATRIVPLMTLLEKIRPMIPAEGSFVDLGCGKGRALLVAAQFGFERVTGVEFARELCEVASRNCAAFKARKTPETEFRVVESDVVDYAIDDDDSVFYLFNPFDEVVLGAILANIAASLERCPRKTLIIYYNPRFGGLIEQHGAFARSAEYALWGYRFVVYSDRYRSGGLAR